MIHFFLIEIYYFFYFSVGITSFDLSATVTSPGGVTEDAEINEVRDGLYAVHFVPKELGVHTVSVRYKDIHIPGKYTRFIKLMKMVNLLFFTMCFVEFESQQTSSDQ